MKLIYPFPFYLEEKAHQIYIWEMAHMHIYIITWKKGQSELFK